MTGPEFPRRGRPRRRPGPAEQRHLRCDLGEHPGVCSHDAGSRRPRPVAEERPARHHREADHYHSAWIASSRHEGSTADDPALPRPVRATPPARPVADERVSSCFRHQGHRTAEAQRALRSRAGPWLGHTTLDGVGQVVAEVPPHSAGLDWNDVNEPAELRSIMQDLGRAVARMHAVPESGHDLVGFSTEEAIMRVIGHDRAGFAGMPVDFAHRYGAQARADHRLFADLFRNGRLPGGRAADLATDQLVWQAPRT